MGVNEAGRPMIHNNHAYGHDVAEAPKTRRRKTPAKGWKRGRTKHLVHRSKNSKSSACRRSSED